MKKLALILAGCAVGAAAWAKLPPPSDEAKAKAAEAAAKTAHAAKVEAYQLCKAQDRVVAHYRKTSKAGKDDKAVATPACADPGPFVYQPAAGAPAAAAPAAAPAADKKPAAKKS